MAGNSSLFYPTTNMFSKKKVSALRDETAGGNLDRRCIMPHMDFYNLPKDTVFLVTQRALITDGEGNLLLLKTACDAPDWEGRWGLPGGLLELGETLEEGLRREVLEETGLQVEMGGLVAASDYRFSGFRFKDGRVKDVRFVLLAYRCGFRGGEVTLSDEHTGFGWISPEEALGLDFTPGSRGVVQKFLERQ